MAEHVIRLEDLGKTFALGGENGEKGDARGITVLQGIDMAVEPGEFVALQGTSGSGKSTLLHIIGLLDRATSGRYLLDGQDVAELDDDALSELRNRKLGFVFQSFYLVSYATALENVLLPGKYSAEPQNVLRQRAESLLEDVGLGDRMQFRPARLSGGQQQRVALARALVNQPDVLLADEPTGQLDSRTSAELLELFQRVNEAGTTILLVTHDEPTAAAARRTLHLADGRFVEPPA